MNNNDRWFFGFITLWIVLTAGSPDVLDGIVNLMTQDCKMEEVK